MSDPQADQTCFVISPIGFEGTEIRRHADDVFDLIISPALERCGLTPKRSDHIGEPGRISEQMFRELLDDRMCVAVLFGLNPNVMYEIAVAQVAARPLVLLAPKGLDPPFDIKDFRWVEYELGPAWQRERFTTEQLRDNPAVDALVVHVEALRKAGWSVPPLFPDDASRKEPPSIGMIGPADAMKKADWMELLGATERHFDVMGIELSSWRKTPEFTPTLSAKADAGCAVRILMMDAANDALPQLNQRGLSVQDHAALTASIAASHSFFSGVADGHANVEVRLLRKGIPHFQLNRFDDCAIAVHYFYSFAPDLVPTIRAAHGTPLYEAWTKDFETLWQLNADDAPPA